MRRGERPLRQLPRPLLLGFVLLLGLQLAAHHRAQERLAAVYQPLAAPLGADSYRGLSMGSLQLLGYLLALRLQLHDNQVGQHFKYSLIDYDLLIDWLDRITEISRGTEYPMLLASRIYSSTGDKQRLRQVIEFIARRFDDNPQLHWRRLAEACLLAKHRLGDLQLALSLAERLAVQPESIVMPQWARDFRFLLLAELNELEAAIAIIQAMLETDAIDDPDEQIFLREKLSDFQQKLFESQHNLPN